MVPPGGQISGDAGPGETASAGAPADAPDRLFIVLSGLPGSGKSAFRAHWLRSSPDPGRWAVLSTDDLVEAAAVRAGTTYDAVKRIEAKPAEKAFRRALRDALEQRRNVLVDRTNLDPVARRRLAARAPAGYRRICFRFDVPEPERQRRLAGRPGKTIPPAIDAEMRARWVPPGPGEGFDEVIRICEFSLAPDHQRRAGRIAPEAQGATAAAVCASGTPDTD